MGPFGGPFNRGADIYHSLLGNRSGVVNLDPKGDGQDHVTMQFGKDARFSFDVDIRTGEVSGAHDTDQSRRPR